jgi:hypothetical protein
VSPPASGAAASSRHGIAFWIAAVIGLGIMAYGGVGLLDAAPATRPGQVGVGLVGLDLLHDAVVAPLVCLAGWWIVRPAPRWLRRPLRWGLLATVMLVLVGWPALRGYGRDRVPDNATVDPLHYGTALATVLLVVWATVGIWTLASWLRRRRPVA